MKKILGLDLGTTSIGWALIKEAENKEETSSIIRTGVRVIPLTTDEETDFQKGKSISINTDRTLKRGARRNLHRYKLRREHLISILKDHQIITNNCILTETGKDSTHSLWKLRSNAVSMQISLNDFARVIIAINKKRGYKSNRKTKSEDEGVAIDGMQTAKLLYDKNITPGQFVYIKLKQGKKQIPDFYRSDLKNEFDKIWLCQKKYYADILTDDLKENLKNKNKSQTWKICEKPFNIVGIKREGNSYEQKTENYKWRVKGLNEKLDLEQLAIVLQEINGQIKNSSGYLGAISDRSKELYFNKQTIGQYLYKQIQQNPHTELKNQVFFRQDYLDEFEKIWEEQSKYYKKILTNELKEKIRDTIIFYQRRLKSQKGLISICELEGREIEIEKNGIKKKKMIGPRVIPKSSPLFQEYKIWLTLNNLSFLNHETGEIIKINDIDEDLSIRNQMFQELNIKGKLPAKEVIKKTITNPKLWEIKNFKEIEGNNTNALLFNAYKKIVELSGHKLNESNVSECISDVFNILGINTKILEFNSDLSGKDFEQQASYQLWHLLYSYEGDNSETGNNKLYKLLYDKFGFEPDYAKELIQITFQDDYGSLSAKAIRKILPYLKAGHEYSEACALAGYKHSNFETKEEIQNRALLDKLELLPKNSLRNPVVEKILNQMVNVVNAIIDNYGKPDEIRIELARELKKSASERANMTSNITKATREHEEIRKKLKDLPPFNNGVRITKNDIIKYKLYKELSSLGYKTIYTNTYIAPEKLFTKEFDIEHIIPKTLLFDDSFSNKTLAVRDFNRVKSNKTGIEAIIEKYGIGTNEYNRYRYNVNKLYKDGEISKAKYNKLLMNNNKIPDDFIERDLRNSQYIAKKAQEMLKRLVRYVTPTTGIITDKLRKDWQLINVMQELNWEKYNKLGMTYFETDKNGNKIPQIKNWTKRNDHRHHAMDAITVAFTKHNYIQYFNYLNARHNTEHKKHSNIYAIEQKETFVNDKNKRIIKPPIPNDKFREEVKQHLENTLISFKTKNKVVTRNINKTKKHGGENIKIELTPRGQLHKETVYGKSKFYNVKEERVGTKFDFETIQKVAKKSYREALLKRLSEHNNDPKKAFGGNNTLTKNPLYLDEQHSVKLPEKVKLVWLDERFSIRKEIAPNLKINKVIDKKVQKLLQKRLDEFNKDSKAAFSNLEENPIWLNKEKGIKLKRVTITGVSNAEALHTKKDHFGKEILDENNNPLPVDFVSTGNNHHVAIYKDKEGNLHEKVVSFFEAVERKNQNLPVIDKTYNQDLGWQFLFSMKQNECFVFPNPETGFNPLEIDLLDENNYHMISPNLFRVQKIGSLLSGFWFRHHLETNIDNNKILKGTSYKIIQSCENLKNIFKVRINHLGQIVKVGEY